MRATLATWKQVAVSCALVGVVFGAWLGHESLFARLGIASPRTADISVRTPSTVRVAIAEVAIARDDLALEAIGTGRARMSVDLRAESAGKIVELVLEANRRFAEGDVLLRLDDANTRLAVELARARLSDSQRTLDRFEQLYGRGAAAVSALDQARIDAEVARIELEIANEAFARRTLRAPFDGVSTLPDVHVGDWIDTDDVVATYDDRSTILVEFDVPELLLPRLALDMEVETGTAAAPGFSFSGIVTAIDSRLDPGSRAARVRVAIPNEDDRLRPGASFTVGLALPGDDFPAVPELALQFTRGGLHVWRIVEDKAEQVPVRLVRRRSGGVLVDGDLGPGDRVVVEGAQRLSPGRPVEIVMDPARRSS